MIHLNFSFANVSQGTGHVCITQQPVTEMDEILDAPDNERFFNNLRMRLFHFINLCVCLCVCFITALYNSQ